MKDEELKQAVIAYASQTSVKECSLLFKDIISYSTIYKWLRGSESLSYTYTTEQCLKELHNLHKSIPSYRALPSRNRIIHTHQPHFFHIERKLWEDKSVKQKLIENRKKYLLKDKFSDREILRGFKISGIHIGYSHFSPLWLKKYVEDQDVRRIYDPCGGWGHRLIGAHLSNIDYIYNDLWYKTYSGCRNIANFLKYECAMYNENCTEFTPIEEYDCVFTCPPYYNVEVYNDNPYNSIEEYNLFLTKMFKCSIKPSVTRVCIVINNTYEQNIIEAIGDEFTLKSRAVLGSTEAISHLAKTKNNMKQEILLNFYREA